MDNAINTLVTQQALDQIQSLINKVGEADKAFANLSAEARETFKSMATPPKTSDALNKQLQETQRILKELQNDYKKQETALANLQKKYEGLATAKKQGNATDRQTIIDNREIRKELDGQAIANSNLTSYIQKLSVERAKASRIVADYNAQVALGTALTEEQSAELAQATASFQKYDNAIKAGKKSIGDAREYVGQYERANLGLVNSVNQIVREVPSATFGIQTFFLAISNNVPIMVDEINQAVASNRKLAQSGEATIPVWKQIGNAILGFNTILNVGLLLLALYGKEIGRFFTELVNGVKDLDDATEAMYGFQKAQSVGIENTKNELQIYREYRKIASDKSLGYEKQKVAIDYLKNSFGGYLKALSDEQIMKLKGSEIDKQIESVLGYGEQYKTHLAEVRNINERIEAYKLEIKQRKEYKDSLEEQRQILVQNGIVIKNGLQVENQKRDAAFAEIEAIKKREEVRKKSIDNEIITTSTTKQLTNEVIELTKSYNASLIVSQDLKDKSILLEEKDTKSKGDNTRAIKLNTKAREDYLASEYELWRLRTQNQSDRNKEIMDDEASGYELRLMASEQYYANELDLANRAAEEELRILAFTTDERKRVAENEFTNSKEQLDAWLNDSKISREQYNKGLKDAEEQLQYDRDGIIKDATNQQNIIYENQAQRLIELNRELVGEMERAWNEINFGKADVLIDERSLKGFEDLGKLLKGIGEDMSIGEIQTKLADINRLQIQNNQTIRRAELQVELDRAEAEKKRIENAIQRDGILNNLSQKEIDAQKNSNQVLIDLDKEIIKSKEDIAKADNEVTQVQIDNALKVKEAKLEAQIELGQELGNLANQLFDNTVSYYDREIEKSNEYYDALLENAESGSEQEQMLLEEKAKKEEELQKRKIAIQRKQAIFNKILAVAEIAMNLQQEISKNNATLGTLLAQPVNALAIASAAIRTATVLATPLPQYEKGTEFHKGGKALVGEKRTEVVENPDGSIFLTPNKPTIMDLKMGAKVYPSVDEFKEKKLAIQNASIMASFGSQSRQLQIFDYYLGRELHGISNKIEKGIERGFKKAKIYNNVRVPKIDIGHLHYKNSGLT